jgi:hypothetical protein
VRAIVHGGASVDDAYAVYMDEKAAGGGSAASGKSAAAAGAGMSDERKI